ncbi:MAG: alpha-L-fucosidase [Alphaproteobacteria bacterium]|nr:alpha-L-fucosidase [Alphaproteobacteria bacterium]
MTHTDAQKHAYRDPRDELAKGPFEPTWESLRSGYRAPDWFRDAKFGIWAHWGPQCQPEGGDWYGRLMYIQGEPAYDHHLKKYGHPADSGMIDIIGAWKGENWNPDELLDLFQKAGARYFVAMANHHDNFDTYNSRWHDWNATRVGPMRDIIGIWAQKARARGLKFGVSNHGAHVWHWFQTAYGYDPEGERAGERYDAWKLTRHDGAGTYWEGLDPQELYGGAVMPMPDGLESIAAANDWHEAHDRVWDEVPPLAHPIFIKNWYRRCRDLVDSYKPDLLYFDNFDLPLGQAGLDIAAHFYNASLHWHDGRMEAVLNTKQLPPERSGALVEDVERGYRSDIVPQAWQTDTCLGDWHYKREIFELKSYVPAHAVIHRLCDVVAKNGNLLLSVPMRGDGTIDSEEKKILDGIAGWIARFGEAIYQSRPWRIAGEGPTEVVSGQFGEAGAKPFTAKDIRFTTKAPDLFALTLGPISGRLTITSLAEGTATGRGHVARVESVDDAAPLSFCRDDKGLHVEVPESAGHAYGLALRLRGEGLVD